MRRFAAALLATALMTLPAAAAPRVIASVVPLHGIISAVMGDQGQPELLLKGTLSEHRATYTPDQIAALGAADIVFIIGGGLEAKLGQMSGSEAVNGKTFVSLTDAKGVRHLAIREGGGWEPHHHEEEHGGEEGHDHGHDHGDDHGHDEADGVLRFDPHVWLDPENAKAMASEAASVLAKADPAHADAYQANARAFAADVDALSSGIAADLAPVKGKPFIVFHDAYQYFESRFGLTAVGSIADVSARNPSAQRLDEVRKKIASSGAVCVFREPQYDTKFADVVTEGTTAKSAVLDPLGAGVTPGPDAYQTLLRGLATDLKACLAGS